MKKENTGILVFPLGRAGVVPTSNLLDLVSSLSDDIYLIAGVDPTDPVTLPNHCSDLPKYCKLKKNEKIHSYKIKHELGANGFTRIINYIYTQLKISYKLAKITRDVDVWIFYMLADSLLLPMLTAKLLGKKVILAFGASCTKSLISANDNFFKILVIFSRINCSLSNRIILYSQNLIKEWNLEKFDNKISIAYEHFLDLDTFKIKKRYSERDNLIGYIGRLSNEKGALNFVKAIPAVLKEKGDLEFYIGGDGPYRNEILSFLNENNLKDKVKILGWIPHDKLPDYLNKLKLLVLPSHTEGLPNIMLEAMACGIPILANAVGSIPDVINDGETGFIMENNSPECITKNIIRSLQYSNLGEVINNARELIKEEFNYTYTENRYKKIIAEVKVS